MKITAAFATDDGISFNDRHFGDARFFDIYEIDENGIHFIKRIDNSTEKDDREDIHGDPVKAGGIMGLLVQEGVKVAVSRNFGPNVKRILKKLACVRFMGRGLNACATSIQKNIGIIFIEMEKGEERKIVTLS